MLALRRASEQYRREVHHQHEHQHDTGAAEDDEGGPNAGDEIGFESHRIEAEPTSVDRSAHGIHRGRQRLRRRTVSRANQCRVGRRPTGPGEIDVEGRIRIGALRRAGRLVSHEAEVRRHHTDHRVRLAVEAHRPADDCGIGAHSCPQLVCQHDD